MNFLAYSCLAFAILVMGGFLTLVICAAVSEYNLARRVTRALVSVNCSKCGGGPLEVTANPLFPEDERYRCCMRVLGRYVICQQCESAFFAAPAGTYVDGVAIPGGAFELSPIDATILKEGLRLRVTAKWRTAAVVGCACLGLAILYAASSYWGLPAVDIVVITVVVGLLLFGRRLPDFIVGRRRMGSQRTSG